ncbi:MAG: GntR family transcriptional regulator [Lentisphaerae bacterium]|jgi:GntR family transcriptional regulator, rspAB operon transcriptional repressor|nr:GntR family transcriptional regulator [Lentisphaerota bacterium]MBT4814944.1 GntR family transcriptional regulator [Lentisphaerota bacterium]MBT5604314.1 GntR family transcriptional regulator [Lentisphaerota bacterium]MBT7060275.1 GntR family transcriptional regulator [Lentisphaerota bacterium]MBT7847558.1 GntR family transcriptional regulator [Lentisphaerota bacterium]
MASSTATLAARAYGALRREITSGVLKPGDRLVRRDIAKRLGVSTIPVIEALLRLEHDGLVESKPNCGARVRPLTLEAIENECVLREAIECQVARLVAETADDRQLEELGASAQRLDAMMQRVDPGSVIGMERHMEFHLRLAEIAGYPLLREQLEAIWLRHLMQLNWVNAAILPVPEKWHGKLMNAFKARDPDTAEAVMRQHVRYGQRTLSEAIQRMGGHVVPGEEGS